MLAVTSLAVLGLSGCALTDKAEALDVRHYAPEVPAPKPAAAALPVPGADGAVAGEKPRLRLGRISASSHLGKKIVYRTSTVDVGIHDDRRWTERPDEYVRRALTSTLFGASGVTQSLAGAAPTLDLELIAFEEIRRGDERLGRVEIRYALHDEREVLLSDSVMVETPAASKEPADLVRAISVALARATQQVSDEVVARLAEDAREVPQE
jgi:cholesterol transport system auxiliary component